MGINVDTARMWLTGGYPAGIEAGNAGIEPASYVPLPWNRQYY